MHIQLTNIEVQLPRIGVPLFGISDLHIESGERVLITGESGRGKTTLLHLMAGLFTPARGEVRVGKQAVQALNDEQRCKFRQEHVAMIFQKLNLIEHLTAIENVSLSLRKGETLEQARAALKAVGLSEAEKKRSSVLSLGEQQRVAVARVLASPRELILADEPTSSLDQRNTNQVLDLLFAAAQGKTLVVVSHDARIESRFDRVLRFEQLVKS